MFFHKKVISFHSLIFFFIAAQPFCVSQAAEIELSLIPHQTTLPSDFKNVVHLSFQLTHTNQYIKNIHITKIELSQIRSSSSSYSLEGEGLNFSEYEYIPLEAKQYLMGSFSLPFEKISSFISYATNSLVFLFSYNYSFSNATLSKIVTNQSQLFGTAYIFSERSISVPYRFSQQTVTPNDILDFQIENLTENQNILIYFLHDDGNTFFSKEIYTEKKSRTVFPIRYSEFLKEGLYTVTFRIDHKTYRELILVTQ